MSRGAPDWTGLAVVASPLSLGLLLLLVRWVAGMTLYDERRPQ